MKVTEAAITLAGVTKHYEGPRGGTVALDSVDLTVRAGETFGLLGPNGAGKTTTIEILAGLRRATSGTVRVFGLDPAHQRDEIRATVAIQPQHAALFERQTVIELLRVWASFYPAPETVDAVITRVGLHDARHMRVGKLSGGQRQRLLVGTALISRPRLLVLDEPSTGLDPNARQELWDAVRLHAKAGGTTLLSTHSMEEAETLCDRAAILHRGRVVACGDPHDLVREHAPEQELLFTVSRGTDLTALRDHDRVLHLSSNEQGDTTRVRVRTLDPDSVFALVTGSLAARRVQIRESGLEAVFRRLTGQTFADVHHERTGSS